MGTTQGDDEGRIGSLPSGIGAVSRLSASNVVGVS